MSRKKSSASGSSKKIIIYALIGVIAVAGIASTTMFKGSGDNAPPVGNSEQDKINQFRETWCGLDSHPNSNGYINEVALSSDCEMPIGILSDGNKVWYVSAKQGILASYDEDSNKFEKHTIPVWKGRSDPAELPSMAWALRTDSSGNIWFTDETGSIWKFEKDTGKFDRYISPAHYPVDIEFDSKGNIYFVGVNSQSLFFGDVSKMKNGTSDGITKIDAPLDAFSGFDKQIIVSGSVAVDNKRDAVWFSVFVFDQKGQIFRYTPSTGKLDTFNLPQNITSPVGLEVDDSGNLYGADHGTSIFFKLDRETGDITPYTTSIASPRIFGGQTPANAYTLPYWIERTDDGLIWFNEHTGNQIAKFDPKSSTLVEYWIPTQNKNFARCPPDAATCGLANAMQFSANNGQVWFTEWTENKIGKVDVEKPLPFSITTSENQTTISRGESKEIVVNVKGIASTDLNMLSSGTFTREGELGDSSGIFSQNSISVAPGDTKSVSFTFTPSQNLQPGRYTIMLGAGTDEVSILKAVEVNIT